MTKPCADTFVFVVGRDTDGMPCLDMYATHNGRPGSLPIAYITKSQLMEVMQGPPVVSTETEVADSKPAGWIGRGINDMDSGA